MVRGWLRYHDTLAGPIPVVPDPPVVPHDSKGATMAEWINRLFIPQRARVQLLMSVYSVGQKIVTWQLQRKIKKNAKEHPGWYQHLKSKYSKYCIRNYCFL